MSVNSTVKKLMLSPEKLMRFYMYKSPLKSLKIPMKPIIFCILKITIKRSYYEQTEIDGIEVIYVVD